jgi:hypothetical protein
LTLDIDTLLPLLMPLTFSPLFSLLPLLLRWLILMPLIIIRHYYSLTDYCPPLFTFAAIIIDIFISAIIDYAFISLFSLIIDTLRHATLLIIDIDIIFIIAIILIRLSIDDLLMPYIIYH